MLWRSDRLHGDSQEASSSHNSFQRLWQAAIHLSTLSRKSPRNNSLIRELNSLIPP
jgi:hypothetical protein